MQKNLFSEQSLIAERRFNFEDYQKVKDVWLSYEGRKDYSKIYLLISNHVSTYGYWLVPMNFKSAEFDLVFKGNEITAFFNRVDKELTLNNKVKRLFLIDVGYACAGIITTNGVITNQAPIFEWMFGKTLQEIKPWLKQQKFLKVEEVNILPDIKEI